MTPTVDVRPIALRDSHPLMFATFDGLKPGDTMELFDDHDPLPLRDRLAARHGKAVTIPCRQREREAVVIGFAEAGCPETRTVATMRATRRAADRPVALPPAATIGPPVFMARVAPRLWRRPLR